MSRPELSVVVPVHNEAAVLPELVERCRKAARQATASFEIVLVDDASTDDTARLLGEFDCPELRVVSLEKNQGQFRATLAGLRKSRGDLVVVLDGDLQDPPELIPRLVQALPAAGECVYAVKQARAERGWFRWGQALFHFLQHRLGIDPPPRGAGSFCLLRRSLAERVVRVRLVHANLAAVTACLAEPGKPTATVAYAKNARYDEVSRVGSWRLVREALGSLLVSGVLGRVLLLAAIPMLVFGLLGLADDRPFLGWALVELATLFVLAALVTRLVSHRLLGGGSGR